MAAVCHLPRVRPKLVLTDCLDDPNFANQVLVMRSAESLRRKRALIGWNEKRIRSVGPRIAPTSRSPAQGKNDVRKPNRSMTTRAMVRGTGIIDTNFKISVPRLTLLRRLSQGFKQYKRTNIIDYD